MQKPVVFNYRDYVEAVKEIEELRRQMALLEVRKEGVWKTVRRPALVTLHKCSICGEISAEASTYCKDCGSIMKKEETIK